VVRAARNGIEPSTSGLKVVHCTLSHAEPLRTAPLNTLSFKVFYSAKHALPCVPVSQVELVTAPNLHEMTSGFPQFSAFGLVVQCNFVH
jgi:hypothetical protein